MRNPISTKLLNEHADTIVHLDYYMQIALNTMIHPCDYENIDIACIITIRT